MVSRATPVFKELGLDQASAQKLVDTYYQLIEAQVAQVNEMRQGWQAQIEKDFAGRLDTVKADVGRMYDTIFGSNKAERQAFTDAMNLTGAGDHPAIVRVFHKLSEAYREGAHVSGGGPSSEGQRAPGQNARPSPAAAMYPNLAR